jgi:hypothetical protein
MDSSLQRRGKREDYINGMAYNMGFMAHLLSVQNLKLDREIR